MPGDDLTIWMWSEACRHLERAETLHRRFYGIAADSAGFSWEPPRPSNALGVNGILDLLDVASNREEALGEAVGGGERL